MEKGKIGVQMMMLKEKVEEVGVYETLRRVSELGYRTVEVSQIPMTIENVSELKRASLDFMIEVAALSTAVEPMIPGRPGETLSADFEKMVQDCKTLNCRSLRIGMLPFTALGDSGKMMAFVKKADEYALKLAEHGISLHYHNHHIELQKHEGEYLLNQFKNHTTHLGFEMDVHWIQRGGENPATFIRKFAGRVELIHLKDYRISPMNIDFLQGSDRRRFMDEFNNVIQFAELGEGNLDLVSIIEAALESGAQYFLVEQDDLYGSDPFECLKTSRDHLRKIGYAHWFED